MADARIFVFGSNLAGRHGKGAALYAYRNHGAIYGDGLGPMGTSYAIPTKDAELRTLPLDAIRPHVADFLNYARLHPNLRFNVTRVGCGLAGYTDADIAPMFKHAPDNCDLPEGWRTAGVATRHPRCGYPYCACVGECFAASQPGGAPGVATDGGGNGR